MNRKLLVIDDEQTIRLSLQEGLSDFGYQVETARDGKSGLAGAKKKKPHAVMLDLRLPDINGLEMIDRLREIDPTVEILMMTAYGDIPTAVSAIRKGAWDYIHKPFDLDEVKAILQHIFSSLKMKRKIYLMEQNLKNEQEKLIGNHPSMIEVCEKINVLAQNDEVTVLIRGETGTGKELVASAIHHGSPRKEAPLLRINCAAIPAQLIESELFGHEKNAFTGAGERKKGLLEIADGGTVFLDEIGEIPMDLQAKLLRVLEEHKFKRIGGLEDIEVDLRIIAATNKNLEKAIDEYQFREDLYYRLNVVPVDLPALRQRGSDILLLTDHFVAFYNQKFNKNVQRLSDAVKEKFLSYEWKGNIRELRNVLERMMILKPEQDEVLTLDELPPEIRKEAVSREPEMIAGDEAGLTIPPAFSLENYLGSLEVKYIQKALKECGDNHTKAAEMLGISRFALKRKLEKHEKEE